MSMALWTLFLFLAGAALVIVEFILPGGILGILGAILIVASTVVGMINFPEYSLFILIGESIGAVATLGVGMYVLTNTKAGGALTLKDSLDNEDGWQSNKTDETLLGKEGVVRTDLHPSGIVEIDDERYDVTSDGIVIEAGQRVRVVKVSGNFIVVEPAEEPAPAE